MELKDSGTRREFNTGAVRDMGDGKGRCDLIPLDMAADWLDSNVLRLIEEFTRGGDTASLYYAMEAFMTENQPLENGITSKETALLEVAKQFEDGAKKYGDDNWRKGIPLHCYIDSAIRHYLKWRRGDTDEPHDRAFVWNILGALWTQEHRPEMIDLPFKENTEKLYHHSIVPYLLNKEERQK
jgi:hypothetical protein